MYETPLRPAIGTAIAPATYPEPVTPMLQVASLADFSVLAANALDAAFGETVIALGAQGRHGLLILRNPDTADRARAIAKDRLPGWVAMEWQGDESVRRFREFLPGIDVATGAGSRCTGGLDHAFPVRGGGTVARGVVRPGGRRAAEPSRPQMAEGGFRSTESLDEFEFLTKFAMQCVRGAGYVGAEDRAGVYGWLVMPPPAGSYWLELLTSYRASETLGLLDNLLVPDIFAPYILYKTLEYCFSKDGVRRSPSMARYCHGRFEFGVMLADRFLRNAIEKTGQLGRAAGGMF